LPQLSKVSSAGKTADLSQTNSRQIKPCDTAA
jgi:hypothetical protein